MSPIQTVKKKARSRIFSARYITRTFNVGHFKQRTDSGYFRRGITRTFYVDHFKQITDRGYFRRGYFRRGITGTFYVSLFNTKVSKNKEKDSNKLRFANILAGFGPFYGIAAKNSVVI